MQLVKAEKKDIFSIYRIYVEAFPKEERMPFTNIFRKENKLIELISIKEENKIIGFFINMKYEDMILISFFAIKKEYRNNNAGGRALEQLKEIYKDKKILLEIEILDDKASNYDMRIRRKNFYKRHGFVSSNIFVDLFGVDLEVMCNNCNLSQEQYINLYENVIGKELSKDVKIINKCK